MLSTRGNERGTTVMKIIATIAAVAVAAITPAAAQASPIRECGNWVQTDAQPGTWHWSYRYSLSYSPVRNLTTRNVSCSKARRFAVDVGFSGQGYSHGFICSWRYYGRGYRQFDVRCTGGSSVIHWQGSTALR